VFGKTAGEKKKENADWKETQTQGSLGAVKGGTQGEARLIMLVITSDTDFEIGKCQGRSTSRMGFNKKKRRNKPSGTSCNPQKKNGPTDSGQEIGFLRVKHRKKKGKKKSLKSPPASPRRDKQPEERHSHQELTTENNLEKGPY